MLKKKRFDAGLFCEAFRQIRMPGILFTVIFTLEAILIPLSTVINRMNSDFYQTHQAGVQSVTGYSAHPILLAAVYLAAPVLMLNLFGFLRSRSASDVYHAVPQTRLCLFISFFSAGALWLLLMIGVSTLASCCMHAAFPEIFSVVWGSVISYMLNMTAAALLCGAVTALAMTVTGTLFNNLLVAAMLLFLPRFILMVFMGAVAGELPMVAYRNLPFLLTYRCNIPAGLVLSVFTIVMPRAYVGQFATAEMLTDPGAMVYTLLLALLYTAAAAALFVRRKSESAGRSSPSRWMQSVYRILVTMTLCVGICALLFGDRNSLGSDWFGYFVLYIIAAVIYFLYELLTTKKWANLLRALPGLGIVAALNIACLLAMQGLYTLELRYTPDAEEIRQVSVVPDVALYGASIRLDEAVLAQTSRIKLEDPEVLRLIADSLKQNVADFRAGTYNYGWRSLVLKIRTGWGVRTREVRFSQEEYLQIEERLFSSEAYAALRKRLPEMTRNSGWLLSEYGVSSGLDDGGAALYALLSEEFGVMSDTQWLYYNWSDDGRLVFYYETVLDGKSVSIRIPMDERLLPRSCTWAMEHLRQEQTRAFDDIRERLSGLTDDDSMYAELYFPMEDAWFYFYSNDYSEEERVEFTAYLLAHLNDALLSDESGRVYLNIADNAANDQPIALDKDALAALPDWLRGIEK